MENKKSFILYTDTYEAIKDLSSDEKAQLLDAIFLYHINPENPVGSLGSGSKTALNFLIAQFKRDNAKYQKKIEANRKNGLKGGRPKTQQNPSKPKKPDSDNGNESEKNNKEKILVPQNSENENFTTQEQDQILDFLSKASNEERGRHG